MKRQATRTRAAFLLALFLIVGSCRAGELDRYTDPQQQTAIGFGGHSHWAQPWRAYLETLPATTFLNGIGINYSPQGDPDIRIRHLAKYGFSRIRLEIDWGSVNDDDAVQRCRRRGHGAGFGDQGIPRHGEDAGPGLP